MKWKEGTVIACAAMAICAGADVTLPVDLNGNYFSGSWSGGSPGIAAATTGLGLAEGQVFERSAGADASVEATYTPFSDTLKPPLVFSADYAGRKVVFSIDLKQPSMWQAANGPPGTATAGEFFQAGLGRRVTASDDNPEVWVSAYRHPVSGEFSISLQTDGSTFGPTYDAPLAGGQTKFRVLLTFNQAGTQCELRITPLNGVSGGTEVLVGPMALDSFNDDLTDIPLFAGFLSFAPESRAAATVYEFMSNLKENALYVFADDPYAMLGEDVFYRVGMTGLQQAVYGFQAFLQNTDSVSMAFLSGAYTNAPFPVWIVDPITSALDIASGRGFGDGPTMADAVLANLRFQSAAQAAASLSFRAHDPPTRFSDAFGGEVLPIVSGGNTAVMESQPPTVNVAGAFQGATNVIGGNTSPGPLEVRLTAEDVGAVYSGLSAQPTVRITWPEGYGTETLNVFAAAGNAFKARTNVTPDIYCGEAVLEVSATDDSGNVETQLFTFEVNRGADVSPTNFTVLRGILQSGGLAELLQSDDQRMVIQQLYPAAATDPNAALTVEAISPSQNIFEIEFTFEASSTGTPSSRVLQRLELFNFALNRWDIVDERAPSFSDAIVTVLIRGPSANDYVQPGTKLIKSRMGWFDRGTLTPNWNVKIDHTIWHICY